MHCAAYLMLKCLLNSASCSAASFVVSRYTLPPTSRRIASFWSRVTNKRPCGSTTWQGNHVQQTSSTDCEPPQVVGCGYSSSTLSNSRGLYEYPQAVSVLLTCSSAASCTCCTSVLCACGCPACPGSTNSASMPNARNQRHKRPSILSIRNLGCSQHDMTGGRDIVGEPTGSQELLRHRV